MNEANFIPVDIDEATTELLAAYVWYCDKKIGANEMPLVFQEWQIENAGRLTDEG